MTTLPYSLPDTEDPAHWREAAAELGQWQQRARLGSRIFTPGVWNSWEIATVLKARFPAEWWAGKRILDIGANTGGLSIELVRLGATVHAVEPWGPFRQKIHWLRTRLNIPDKRLDISEKSLFDLPFDISYDLILCLGLVYHFRHPQLVIDHVGNMNADHFVFSTQTIPGDQLVMKNRAAPEYPNGDPLGGWHPTRALFIRMLTLAGLKNPQAISHPLVNHNLGERTQMTTNSAYFVADRGTPVDIITEAHRFL